MDKVEQAAKDAATLVVNMIGPSDPLYFDDDVAAIQRQFILFYEQTQRMLSDTSSAGQIGRNEIIGDTIDAGTVGSIGSNEAQQEPDTGSSTSTHKQHIKSGT